MVLTPTDTMLGKRSQAPKQYITHDSNSTYFQYGQIQSMIFEIRIVVPLGGGKCDWGRLPVKFLKVLEIVYSLT